MYHHDSITDFGPFSMGFPGSSVVKNPLANKGAPGNAGSIPGLGRSPGGRNGNAHQYSCLENPMDIGAWWATIHEVAKSWTWLSAHTPVSILAFNRVLCFHVTPCILSLAFLAKQSSDVHALSFYFPWKALFLLHCWRTVLPDPVSLAGTLPALWMRRPTPSRPIMSLLKHLLRTLWELPCDNSLFSCCFQDSLSASALWVLLQCVLVRASFRHLEFGCPYPALSFRSFLTFLLGLPRDIYWSTRSCSISLRGFPRSSSFFFLFAPDLVISSDLSSNSNSAVEHSREIFNLGIVFFSSRICLVLFYPFSFLIFASLVAQ